MELLDGKLTSSQIKDKLKAEMESPAWQGVKKPHLAAVLVGEDGASRTYVNAKVKACEYVGFDSTLIKKPSDISEEELLNVIEELNNDDAIDGFIIQLPLPIHIDESKVTEAVAPRKDVDGFHPENQGKMVLGEDTFVSATPYGIMQLFEAYKVETEGKHCVVIGRSNIVGTPMSILMSRNTNPGNATVTLTHSRTKNLKELTLQADIVIVALGVPGFLKSDMVKDGAVIVDVGITRVDDPSKERGFYLMGDVDFENVQHKASYITPVPGGVGPMTIASLLMNTLKAAKNR